MPTKANKLYLALKLREKLEVSVGEFGPTKVCLPPGCVGVLFAFKTKKAGKEFIGKDTRFSKFTFGLTPELGDKIPAEQEGGRKPSMEG